MLPGGARCWGFGGDGRLGYGMLSSIGDDETPGSVGPIDVGAGRRVEAISAGSGHTCALLDDGSVRCWGFGGNGRLGYANTNAIGGAQAPGSVGPVDLGTGRTARAISAGDAHTCAVLDNGTVRCWGFGLTAAWATATATTSATTSRPARSRRSTSAPAAPRAAISAGRDQTCALLDDATVRCWGYGGYGHLGYASIDNVGDDETPGSVGPVDLGAGRSATAISAGNDHTCAVLAGDGA